MNNPEDEKYFTAIADTTNDMIHLNDLDGRIIYANKATEAVLGYSREEVVNHPAFDIIHPEDQEAIKQDMLNLISNNNVLSREIRLLKKDGTYVDVEVRGFLVDLDDKKFIGAVISDISTRKKNEQELALYREKLEEQVKERTQMLENAQKEIKTLKGILPICMHCKKIRDENGQWQRLENYIHRRSEAEFSHGVCPECIANHHS